MKKILKLKNYTVTFHNIESLELGTNSRKFKDEDSLVVMHNHKRIVASFKIIMKKMHQSMSEAIDNDFEYTNSFYAEKYKLGLIEEFSIKSHNIYRDK